MQLEPGMTFTYKGTEYTIMFIKGGMVATEDYNKNYYTYWPVNQVEEIIGKKKPMKARKSGMLSRAQKMVTG